MKMRSVKTTANAIDLVIKKMEQNIKVLKIKKHRHNILMDKIIRYKHDYILKSRDHILIKNYHTKIFSKDISAAKAVIDIIEKNLIDLDRDVITYKSMI